MVFGLALSDAAAAEEVSASTSERVCMVKMRDFFGASQVQSMASAESQGSQARCDLPCKRKCASGATNDQLNRTHTPLGS